MSVQRRFGDFMNLSEEFLATFKGLVFQIRSEGIGLSDRRVVKLLKMFAASAIFDGREPLNDADFFILRHVWNTPEQEEMLQEIVGPVLDRWYESDPDHARIGATPTSLQDLFEELRVIRETLTGSEVLSDMQLFSQLRNLGDIKAALHPHAATTPPRSAWSARSTSCWRRCSRPAASSSGGRWQRRGGEARAGQAAARRRRCPSSSARSGRWRSRRSRARDRWR
jgi:hypothetical protein